MSHHGYSGHKSENSIKNYSSVCPDSNKRQMFDVLADNMQQKQNEVKGEAVPNPRFQEVNQLQQASFDLVQLIPDFKDEQDPIETDNILAIIDKIEKENAAVVPQSAVHKQVTPTKSKPKSGPMQNMNHNLVVQNVNKNPFSAMFFLHSNVTINYNFKS